MLSSEWWSFRGLLEGQQWACGLQRSRPIQYLWSHHPTYWMLELPEWSWGCSSLPTHSENATSVMHKLKQVKNKLIIYCKLCGGDERFGFTHGNASHYNSPFYVFVNLPFIGNFKSVHLFSAFPLATRWENMAYGHALSFAHSYRLFSTPKGLVLISYNSDSH